MTRVSSKFSGDLRIGQNWTADMQAELYRTLDRELPGTTIVSIGHRVTLIALHHRHVKMEQKSVLSLA